MPTIDFGKAIQDARGASFEALPIGDYDVEVTKSEAVTSQNGKPMIKVTMKVVSGPYEKRPIINNFVLSLENAQATAIFFRHMKAFGLTEEWFAGLGQQQSLEPVASALLNRRARLTVGHREWQGEMRNEVKGVKPYTGAPGAPLPSQNGGPTGFSTPGPTAGPVAGPPIAGPTPPAAPVAAPAPVPAPTPVPTPAPVADAPSIPQVQPMPQPPAQEAPAAVPSVPTPSPVAEPAPSESAPTTSEVAQPTPPTLPF